LLKDGHFHPFPVVLMNVLYKETQNNNKKNGELLYAYDVERQY
jgi:hypothetical protein